ncbi:hypothetical protein [Halanaerobacter jeridensis]|uniref:Uncharacterized protein n=1 Tax=Halanaerobacter jeridensis TaxID=706427 RepID=A0A938XQE5_9FIRM|nr:hypothetical protein [Halanaerobacter jeridensis]MBM7555674.1 hypothetical protein [Halanaerobacter jeridensis]
MRKITIVLLIVITLLSLNAIFNQNKTSSQGIIIADHKKLINIFRDYEPQATRELIKNLQDYEQVILHLGAKRVFIRGNAFFYRTSQDNLKLLAEQLQANEQQLYLWFLDSFGGASFLEIYEDYQTIIDANYEVLQELNLDYEGLVIDLEWINLGTEANNQKYLEILSYLDKKFADKELYAFASIIDNPTENKRRGYNETEMLKYLDNIITMLYPGDGGYYLKNGQLHLNLATHRIEDLREYYRQRNYQVAVSLAGRIILERNNNLYFIKSATEFNYSDKTKLLYSKTNKYYDINAYVPQMKFSLQRNDGVTEEIKKSDRLHFINFHQDKLLQEEDYIWEYFLLQ